MDAITLIIFVHITTGVIYTIFLFTKRRVSVFSIPFNILGGPVMAIYYFIKFYYKKDYGPANIRHKEILKDKKAVFFDLDGTVWDSNKVWVDALQKTAENNGFEGVSIIDVFSPGRGLKETWKALQLRYGLKMPKDKNIEALAKETEQEVINRVKGEGLLDIVEGFKDLAFFLKEERQFKLALVTNSSSVVADEVVKKADMGYIFDLILTGDKVSKKKPSPKIFLKAARMLRVHPKEVLVFEDSLSGSKAASKAGMDQVIIWRNDIPQVEYSGNIYGFFPDFVDLDRIMSVSSKERILEGIKHFREEKGLDVEGEENQSEPERKEL